MTPFIGRINIDLLIGQGLGPMAELKICELVDCDYLGRTLQLLYRGSTLPATIFDSQGRVLASVPEEFAGQVLLDERYVSTFYQIGSPDAQCEIKASPLHCCLVEIPIIIEQESVALLRVGPFFYSDEVPSAEQFVEEVSQFLDNVSNPLALYEQIPHCPQSQIEQAIPWYLDCAEHLTRQTEKCLDISRHFREQQVRQRQIEQNEKHYQGIVQALDEARWRAETVNSVLAEISQYISGSEIAEAVVREISKVLDAPRCSMVLYQNGKTHAEVVAFYRNGKPAPFGELGSMPMNRHPGLDLVLKSGKSVRTKTQGHPPEQKNSREVLNYTWNYLLVPIALRGDVIGTLNVAREIDKPPCTEADRIMIETICKHVAQALKNVQALEEQARARQSAEKANKDLEVVNLKLEHSIAQAEALALEARQANMAKGDFLANMSHEIRTPMNAIVGFSDLLAKGNLSEEDVEYAQIISNAGRDLLRIINDILDFTKIDSGKLEVDRYECTFDQITTGLDGLLGASAAEKRLEFQINLDSALPDFIITDPGRVRQCLINLISNAVKFTDSGYVKLNVRPHTEKGKLYIRFEVVDTGVGIPKNKVEHIFESFSQADSSTTRKYDGTGLGLTITRKLAEILGGRIDVKSAPGEGSTFSMLIDAGFERNIEGNINSVVRQEVQTVANISLPAERVLVVEDDAASSRALVRRLEYFGFQCQAVKDGVEALAAVEKESFAMIFMDMQIPNMNGYEATRTLREKRIETPVVAVTAYAMTIDRDKCLQAGCNDYIAKPVSQDELLKVLEEYFSKEQLTQSKKEASQLDSDRAANEFMKELEGQVVRIVAAAAQEDYQGLNRILRQLSRHGSQAGFIELVEKAGEIQEQLRQQQFQLLEEQVYDLGMICRQLQEKNSVQ